MLFVINHAYLKFLWCNLTNWITFKNTPPKKLNMLATLLFSYFQISTYTVMMTHMILPLEESKSQSWGAGAGFVGKGGVGLIISKEFHSPTFNAVAVSGRKVVVGAGGRAASCINEQQGWRWVSKLNWWTAGRGQGKIRIDRLVLQPFNIVIINDFMLLACYDIAQIWFFFVRHFPSLQDRVSSLCSMERNLHCGSAKESFLS